MLFIAKGSHPRNTPLKLNHDICFQQRIFSKGNSQVASPVSPGHGRQHQYFDKSPSPPNGEKRKGMEVKGLWSQRFISVEFPLAQRAPSKSPTIVASWPPVPFKNTCRRRWKNSHSSRMHRVRCYHQVPLILDRLFQIWQVKDLYPARGHQAATHFLKGLRFVMTSRLARRR